MQACSWCEDGLAAWVHRVDTKQSQHRVYGKGQVWGPEVSLCERCERLYRAGDDDALVAVSWRPWQQSAQDVEEGIRHPLAALRRADRGALPMSDWLPPGVPELVAEGFTPIDELTGDEQVAAEWPVDHRRAVRETRPGRAQYSQDGLCWLVRSPWPTIAVEEVVELMWAWKDERRPTASGRVTDEDVAAEGALIRQFLRFDEATALGFRESRRSND